MANVQVLEQEGEQGRPAPEAEEDMKFETSVENMERIVLQSEVPNARTCITPKVDGSEITPTDLGVGCRQKT
eukprot:13904033-Heterocapsa_arctica.AAC.1